MTDVYRIFGAELSPYSVKVRSYFRYKRIPHEWIVRSAATQAEYQKYAKLPLIPLVVTPEGEALQDSTPIIEAMEIRHPEPALQPDDVRLAFLSVLIEEYGDEWGNKPMFHYRWAYRADQDSAAQRIALMMLGPDATPETVAQAAEGVKQRMVPRLSFVGSSAETRGQIERSFERQLTILNAHLAERPYLFGGRPCLADFGLYAQLYEAWTDPTPKKIFADFPATQAWVERMLDPNERGGFETWNRLGPTLSPLLSEEVAGLFLPWSDANARALARAEETFTVALEGQPFRQHVQKYHARSLAALRAKYAAVAGDSALDQTLAATGCLAWLAA